MALDPFPVTPVNIPDTILTYRPVTDIAPFTYRAGMTYQALLEQLRVYIVNTLVPYVTDEFGEFEGAWEANVSTLIEAVNTALKTQTDNISAELAQTLADIVAGANVPLNDANTLNVLSAAASTSRDYLDARYAAPDKVDANTLAALKSNGSSTLAYMDQRYSTPVTGIATPEMFKSAATLDGNGNVIDWAPAINAAFAAGYADIELSSVYYWIRTPIRIPSNRGPRIFTRGGKKAGYLNVGMDNNFPTRAAIEYVGARAGGSYNYAGITMENVCMIGNGSTCHAIWLQDVSYPNFARVNIAGFNGAGLLIDNCQDGSFDIEVQGCGRTNGNPTVLADRSNNALTTYAAIHLISTADADGAHNNMLRFTGEIEQNNVSPYVRIHDSGAINLWFNDIHAETHDVADWGYFDFLECIDGADCEFKGMYVATEMRNGFILSGFGAYRFIGGRSLNNVVQPDSNSAGQLNMVGCSMKVLRTVAWSGAHKVTNCNIDYVGIDYPGGGPFRISDSQIATDVRVTNAGSTETGVIFDNCRIGGTMLINEQTAQCQVRNCHIVGDASIQSQDGLVENTQFDGALSYLAFNSTFRPKIKEQWQGGVPQYGAWKVGDRIWNYNPAAGGNMGWVCVAAGTPGTWKPFGTIGA